MNIISGFESTHIFGSGKDVLQTTRHAEFYERDLRLVKETGIKHLRYSVPWHQIEREKGVYDWSWMDKAVACLREFGIKPIFDPLHHTSFPEWLTDGFANPEFAESYLRFVSALSDRYWWVRDYTVFNESFVTTWFCGHEGVWYPYRRGAENFVPMLMNVGRAIVSVSRMLIEKFPDVQLIHVEAAETHRALDIESEPHAFFGNAVRFLVPDLVLGKLGERHQLYSYLRDYGAAENQLAWFVENPARLDVLGLDYYSHCELEWSVAGRVLPNQKPTGFVPIALEYAKHYELPVMLTETNIRGYVTDRISWLKFMVEQCEILEEKLKPLNLSFEGFCWYPFIDSTDWDSLLTEANHYIDPQGIFWLDQNRQMRHASELSEIFSALARGQITSKDIPAYRFLPPLDETLENFLPLMAHWHWKEPHRLAAAA